MNIIEIEPIKSKLKKLNELAQRGVDGEQTAAAKKLQELLKLYKISFDEVFNDDEKKDFEFKISSEFEEKLVFQVIFKCTEVKKVAYHKKGGKIIIEMQISEGIEAQYLYDIYRNALNAEMHTLTSAFIQVNKIFSSNTISNGKQATTAKELNTLKMAKHLNPTEIHTAIETSTDTTSDK